MIKLPFGVDIKNLINDLRNLSWQASDTLLYYAQKLKDSNRKSIFLKNSDYENPVTLADLKVNQLVIKKINDKYRGTNWAILSEENVKSDPYEFDENLDWEWILDPLDGTKDFIQGTPNYAMHLALNYKHKPYIGVVLIPERDELWIADGKLAWCEKRDGTILENNLYTKKNLQELVLVTSENHRNATLNDLIQKIQFKKVVTMGSIGCKIASILRGESDIYICLSLPGKSSPKDWDFASPEAILKASGGSITNLDNEDLIYGKSNFSQGGIIVASNNIEMHKIYCKEIKELVKIHKIYPF